MPKLPNTRFNADICLSRKLLKVPIRTATFAPTLP